MKVTITVGPVRVRIVGLDVSERQVRRLLAQAGQIAESLVDTSPEAEASANPVGFTAHLERAGEIEPEYQFTDDE